MTACDNGHLLEAGGRRIEGRGRGIFGAEGLGEVVEDALQLALRHDESGVL